jgi:hypothetical protein
MWGPPVSGQAATRRTRIGCPGRHFYCVGRSTLPSRRPPPQRAPQGRRRRRRADACPARRLAGQGRRLPHGASTALATLCTGLEQRAAATSARKLLELLVDTSQRQRRRPRHPECAALPSRPSRLNAGPSVLCRRLRASTSASGAARSAPHPMLCLCYPTRCHRRGCPCVPSRH